MDLVIRFIVGGLVVSCFALLGDVLQPKSFAGLLGAAPSIALATISLTVFKNGRAYAALEARSMILGAIAFLVYAAVVSVVLMRKKGSALATAALLLALWLGSAFGLWYAFLG